MPRLKDLRKAKGLTQAHLADKIGASQSDIARLENGSRRLTADWIRRIAAALEVQPAEILDGGKAPAGDGADGSAMEDDPAAPGEVPVFGYAVAGATSPYINFHQSAIGNVPAHPRQKGVEGAFAAHVVCNSMVPRYRPGELVYVIPNEWPATGEDCVVELRGGRGFLKEYRTRTEREIICWQHHPPSEWRRRLAEVAGVHLVVGRG